MSRPPASQRYRRHKDRWKRYGPPQPGSRVQIDVKFIAPLPGSRKKHYQYAAIDDCTRIRVLRVYDRCTQTTSIRFSMRSWPAATLTDIQATWTFASHAVGRPWKDADVRLPSAVAQ